MNENGALRAIVVGGSMAGLTAALVLREAGCAVEVFEKSAPQMEERGAGVVVQAEVLKFLVQRCGAQVEALGVISRQRQLLSRDGAVIWQEPDGAAPQIMTSWGTLYRCLRRAFPDSHYHHGARLSGLQPHSIPATVQLDFGRDERSEVQGDLQGDWRADLMVLADGANSTARRLLMPEVAARYAGYVAWRGMVDENAVAPALRARLAEKFTFFHAPGTQMLAYLVPGVDGAVAPGRRRINWVWYWNVAAGEELRALMTDRDGLTRDYSLPQGALAPELLRRQLALAQRVLPQPFADLFAATADPFIQPIYDLEVPRMVFGSACLVGDAAFVPRPHTAASTYKAFADAIGLGACLTAHDFAVAPALAAWQVAQMRLGRRLVARGRELGEASQFDDSKQGLEAVRLVAKPVR